ncbi:MAG: CHAD domain-containing protein, partial [Rhodospirillales bacterium]|nr:CHAD domain-containing protein [Rhodospirillales bacterium]
MPHPDRNRPTTDSAAGAGTALGAMIEAALSALRADLPRALAGEAEAVHRMRSALRRLRALLRAARPVLPASVAGQARSLQRLGRALGPARDWDVFLDETLPRAAAEGLAPIALGA